MRRLAALLLLLALLSQTAGAYNLTHFGRGGRELRMAAATAASTSFDFALVLDAPWTWAQIAAFANNIQLYTGNVSAETGVACDGCALTSVIQNVRTTALALDCLFDASVTTEADRTAFVRALGLVSGMMQTAATTTASLLVEPNAPFHLVGEQINLGPELWHLDRLDVHARAYDRTYHYPTTATDTIVYVIDTGVYGDHPEFVPAGRAQTVANTVDASALTDCHGHGTHVSSLIAGVSVGVAKLATVRAIKALDCSGSGSAYSVVAALLIVEEECLAHPADAYVINFSLNGPGSTAVDSVLARLINECHICAAVAAGNSGMDACATSPARVAAALTISATDVNDATPSWSNYGSCVDMAAPGVAIRAAFPPDAYQVWSGTSMAAPLVAGSCALLVAQMAAAGVPSAAPTTPTPDGNAGIRAMATLLARATVVGGAPKPVLYSNILATAENQFGALVPSPVPTPIVTPSSPPPPPSPSSTPAPPSPSTPTPPPPAPTPTPPAVLLAPPSQRSGSDGTETRASPVGWFLILLTFIVFVSL